MKPFTIHPDAELELHDAVERYERERTGLGGRFLAEFEAAIQRVRHNPLLYAAEDESGVRFCPVHRFSYTIVYFDLDSRVWVVAVAHQRRRPRYWAGRTPS